MMEIVSGSKQPVALFDIDGAFYRDNALIKFAEQLCRRGFFPKVVTRALYDLLLRRSDRSGDYRANDEKIVRTILIGLRGKKTKELMREAELFHVESCECVHSFTVALLNAVRITHQCIAITGGINETAHNFAEHWGFDACISSILETIDGVYTGRVAKKPVSDKGRAIREVIWKRNDMTLTSSIGIGDTVSDLPFLEMTDTPIAFNPDNRLAEAAERNRWPIVVERKDSIYVTSGQRTDRFGPGETIMAVSNALRAAEFRTKQ
jgi:phosphoserine phosphatase